jgi:hypothetical protein
VDALRKSLAVELRHQIPSALLANQSLRGLPSIPITARTVESVSRMPAPVIYSANAGKIGLLEGDAMDVVIVYALLESARDRVARLMSDETPDDIERDVVLSTADDFLAACKYALGVLPRLRTGDASNDAKDEALTKQIDAALAARRARS